MVHFFLISLFLLTLPFANTQHPSSNPPLRTDPGRYGPPLEEYHYYYTQWPIGLAVSSTGRLFTCYTRGNYTFTLGEAVNKTAEVPYPYPDQQVPVSALDTKFFDIRYGNSDPRLISVQALYITPQTSTRPETLWVVDTGRPTLKPNTGLGAIMHPQPDGPPETLYAQPGGPKILAISLDNNTIYRTYTFPPSVHFPDSYMNDIRIDLRPSITPSGAGIAYIVDSSDEGRPGFIVLDLGTGDSWRRLTQHASVLRVPDDVPSYVGSPFYLHKEGAPVSMLREGLDGIQISPDGETIYYSPLTSDYLYSVPARNLRVRPSEPLAEVWAAGNVSSLGQRGGNANGFEGDDGGRVYQLMPEHNAIYYYDPRDGLTHSWVRDPRIIWPDSASVGEDGYLYVNVNQLMYQGLWNGGVDKREWPGVVLRAKLPDGGRKIRLV